MSQTFLIVTIDTEEDQWGPSEGPVSVSNAFALPKLQSLLDDYGIVPTYLVNYPVVADAGAYRILAQILNRGRCEIGTHLHPWNTPPFGEQRTNRNSMLGNLPYELQLEKLALLTQCLESRFGIKTTSFRAGRWALGKDTVKALLSCGYEVDTSVTPFVSWTPYEGPSFISEPLEPYLMTVDDEMPERNYERAILEVPASIGYSRWPFTKQRVRESLLERLPSALHAKGVASRLNILRRISLCPETESLVDMLLLSRILLRRGIKVLNVFFHSNSLIPGMTPFIRTSSDVEEFHKKLAAYFKNLLTLADIKPIGLSQVKRLICKYQLQNNKNIGILDPAANNS